MDRLKIMTLSIILGSTITVLLGVVGFVAWRAFDDEPDIRSLESAIEEWRDRVVSGELEQEDFPRSLSMALEVAQFTHNGAFGPVGTNGLPADLQQRLRHLTLASMEAGWNLRKLTEDCDELLADVDCAEILRLSVYGQ